MNEILQKVPKLPKSYIQMGKLILIGFIILVLMIPVVWISTMIRERNDRKASVLSEIASKWGTSQYITGPFISVPYHRIITSKDDSGNETQKLQKEYLQISPASMDVKGKILSETHHRGIFKVIGYKADLDITSSVSTLLDPKDIPPYMKLEWNDAFISFGLSDQHGLKELNGTMNGQPLKFDNNDDTFNIATEDTAKKHQSYENGNEAPDNSIFTKLNFAAKTPLTVETGTKDIKLHIIFTGTDKLAFLTSAMQESVHLNGDWSSPSFIGNMLPETKTLNKKGFDAIWHANYLTTGNKSSWTSENQNQKLSNFRNYVPNSCRFLSTNHSHVEIFDSIPVIDVYDLLLC